MKLQDANPSPVSIMKNTVIPWVERDGMANIFTACPKWRAGMDLPEGMTATRKPLRGKRVPAAGGRPYGNASVVEARWPEDNLCSARIPKLSFVLAGPMALQIANYVVHCLPGHGILLPAGIPFGNISVDDQYGLQQKAYEWLQLMPYHGGLIYWFNRRWWDANGKSHVSEQTYSIPHSLATSYLNQLVDEAEKHEPNQSLICDSLLKLALALLLREIQQLPALRTGEIASPTDAGFAGRKYYPIAEAQKYIEAHLRNSLTIRNVARYVCMSRSAFTAQFRAITGKTFTRYVQDLRLEEARKLLRETDFGVGHIAAAVGFKPNRIRELFREREHISPLEYRQRSRESCKK